MGRIDVQEFLVSWHASISSHIESGTSSMEFGISFHDVERAVAIGDGEGGVTPRTCTGALHYGRVNGTHPPTLCSAELRRASHGFAQILGMGQNCASSGFRVGSNLSFLARARAEV